MAVMPQGANTISGGIVLGTGLGIPIPSAGAPSAGTNAVQTISVTGTVSGGTYRLNYAGAWTIPIAFGAANATIDAALETVTGAGTITMGGTGLPGTSVTVTFGGSLAGAAVSLLTVDNSALTGGGSYSVAMTTPGVNATGRGAALGGLLRDTLSGQVYKNTTAPPQVTWGSPVALEEEAEEGEGKKGKKSVKGPPEDKAHKSDDEKSDDR